MTENNEKEEWNSIWREAVHAMSLGWDIAVPIFGGVFLGYFMDRWLGTGYIFTIGLLFLGVFMGYYNLIRSIQRINRETDESQDKD